MCTALEGSVKGNCAIFECNCSCLTWPLLVLNIAGVQLFKTSISLIFKRKQAGI